MIKHVLIDTCSLRHLIDYNSYSQYIIQLTNLINQSEVQMLTHQNIIEEWQKHKHKWRRDIERKLNFQNKNSSDSKNLPSTVENPKEHLEVQLTTIDELLNNAWLLDTPEGIKNESYDRIKLREAPFHYKIDSINDWEIIGSAGTYCSRYGIKNLYFISNNHTDFGHEHNEYQKVHTSLNQRFSYINIIYYKDIAEFFKDSELNSFSGKKITFYKILANSKFSYESSLANNVLDALDRIFNDTYKELGFIPLSILRNLYPFSKSKKSNVYSDLFKLSNVNPELVYFFKNVKMLKNGKVVFNNLSEVQDIKNYEKKTLQSLRNLRKNIIYYLNEHVTRDEVEIEYHSNIKCDCYRCCYERFNFVKALEDLRSHETIDNRERLKMAYYHYKLGNLTSAVSLYREILPSAVQNKEFFIYLIANYNLKNIAPLLNNMFRTSSIDKDLVDELEEIDLYEISLQLKGHIDYNFAKFLIDESYFNLPLEKITQLSKEIIEHYNMQLRGGWSSNNKVWSLISEYAKMQRFIKENYIICDEYNYFTKLFDSVLEGIFASYSLEPDQGGRLECIDTYWINNIVFYSKKDFLKQHIKRYKITFIKLSENQNVQKHILKIANNLFSHLSIDVISNKIDKNNDFLHEGLSTFFDNFITLCSFLLLDSNTTIKLSKKILILLKKENILYWQNIESILLFIMRNKLLLPHTVLVDYFNYFLSKEKCNSLSDMLQIINCFQKDSLTEITDKQFNELLNLSVNTCSKCGNTHDIDIIISLFDKVSIKNKRIISAAISKSLIEKFSFNMFYHATIYDIIEFDENILQQNLKNFQPFNKNNTTFKSLFSGKNDPVIPYLNQMLNLSFKCGMIIDQNTLENLGSINDYYKWLLDMEAFEYKNFDPNWITLYKTNSFLLKMKASKKLNDFLITYLKETSNPKISDVFFKIQFN
ncbi:hypothetical protein D3C71_34410 [compost metagenome]